MASAALVVLLGRLGYGSYEQRASLRDDERQNDPDDKSRKKTSELVITRASHRYGQHHGHRVADGEPSNPWHARSVSHCLTFNDTGLAPATAHDPAVCNHAQLIPVVRVDARARS